MRSSVTPTAFLGVCALVWIQPSTRADCPLEESGHWGGTVNELIDHGGYLYAAIGRRLDVIEPGYPHRIAQLTFPSHIHALAIEGHEAFVVSGDSLSVVEISLPDQPRVIAELSPVTFGVNANGFATQDGYLYCVDSHIYTQTGAITVVDSISHPPQVVGAIETPGESREFVAISPTHLYLRRDGGGLLAFDLATPAAPTFAGSLLETENVLDLNFEGDTPVAGIEGRGLVTLDFSDPLLPVILGEYALMGDIENVRARGTRVVATQNWLGHHLGFFSIDDPAAPRLVESRWSEIGNWRVAIGGHYVVTARAFQDLFFFANPFPEVFYDGGRYLDAHRMMGDIATDDEFMYVPSADILKIVRACGPSTPETAAIYAPRPWLEIPGFTAPDIILHVCVADGYAYLTTHARGLCVVDVRNPLAPRLIVETNEPVRILRIRSGLAYGITDEELRIYDLANPELPALLGRVATQTNSLFDVDQGVACFIGYSTLRVLDVSDPTAPFIAGTAPLNSALSGIAVHDRTMYLADYPATVSAYDLTDLGNPVRANLRGELAHANAGSLRVRDGLLYAGTRLGLTIWDLADAREPRRIADQATYIGPHEGIGLLRDCAVLSSSGAGINVVSIPMPGDINADHNVDLLDLALLLGHFGQFVGGGPGNGDFNCDGWVDLSDLSTLLSTFGATR